MEKDKVAVVAAFVGNIFNGSEKHVIEFQILPSEKPHFTGRMLVTLGDYLTKHSKKFNRVRYIATNEMTDMLPNGTIKGILGMVNRSEIDIGAQFHVMDEVTTDIEDFAYPFELDSCTFVTRKAEYEPQIFAILQTFSLPLWIAIITTLIVMSLVHYVTFKGGYSFDKILLHVFAVLLRQCSILKPPSVIKQLLVFSWVIGAMFLCLAYDSVVLSFLSFPPVNQVKDVPQLAKAVEEGRYHCVTDPGSAILNLLLTSNNENLKIIGQDIKMNSLSNENTFTEFVEDRNKPNLALIFTGMDIDLLTVGQKFVSQDRFIESMSSMPIRKDFCCKKLLDNFVHRMMASGLHFKHKDDAAFLVRLPWLMRQEVKDNSKRILTLTDVAPAFIFLIFGHIISFLVLIVEILTNRMNKKYKKVKSHAKKILTN